MNLTCPTILGGKWYLLGYIHGFYGNKDSPCSMGVYISFESEKHFIYFSFLNGVDNCYGYTDASGGTEEYTIEKALIQAWQCYKIPPEHWILLQPALKLENDKNELIYQDFHKNLEDYILGKKTIDKPVISSALASRYFNAYSVAGG